MTIALRPDLVPVLKVPAVYFSDPSALLAADTKLTVDLDEHSPTYGRVYGIVAPPGRCLTSVPGECWTIEDLRADDPRLELVHQGDAIVTDNGETVKVAALAGAGGHSPEHLRYRDAKALMDDPSRQIARLRYHWSEFGLVASGVIARRVIADEELAATFLASPSSMDARLIPQVRHIRDAGGFRLCGAVLVNQPGFPISRAASAGDIASGDPFWLVDGVAMSARLAVTDAAPTTTAGKAKGAYQTARTEAWDQYMAAVVSARTARDATLAGIADDDPDRGVKVERINDDFSEAKASAKEERSKRVTAAREERATVARSEVDRKRADKQTERDARKAERDAKKADRAKAKTTSDPSNPGAKPEPTTAKDAKPSDAARRSEASKALTARVRAERKAIYAQFAGKLQATPTGRSAVYAERSKALAALREKTKAERAALVRTATAEEAPVTKTLTAAAAFAVGDDAIHDGQPVEIVGLFRTSDGVEMAGLDNDLVVPVADLEPDPDAVEDAEPKAAAAALASACSCSKRARTAAPMDERAGTEGAPMLPEQSADIAGTLGALVEAVNAVLEAVTRLEGKSASAPIDLSELDALAASLG